MKDDQCLIRPVGNASVLWRYTVAGTTFDLAPPRFEIDGTLCPATLRGLAPLGAPREVFADVTEYVYEGTFAEDDDLSLRLVVRLAADSPVVRFRYELRSRRGRSLTKRSGRDALDYLTLDLRSFPKVKEVRFSEFRETVHSFCLAEVPLTEGDFANERSVMGPMVVAGDTGVTALLAYEHGSQVPDAFLHYRLGADRRVSLAAVKGNYYADEPFSNDAPYTTVWFQFAAVAGDEDCLARAYRRFVLEALTPNRESRRPYVFYNSWAFQERNKWWNGKQYLDSMNEDRMLAEIEVAHRMGIDVFVLDTGWFEKTGDWEVSRRRFPNGLGPLKERLDRYGMKLGLWFDPLAAAVSSRMAQRHPDCVLSWRGQRSQPGEVWETEASYRMCLVSRYADAFADELIRLVKEVGVTYFKWDAIHQYGCDDPGHQHGGSATTEAERADCYAFRIGLAMIRIVDRLCAACPEAIVDFDITEGHRFVGLGFLAAGKYFLINNGPYYPNYDIPYQWATATSWSNIFVHPGPARGWICRTPLTFDKWVPSVLFLTHYLPDDPESSQLVNIGSLILGQNGIWGDLLAISPAGVARFGTWLGRYKQVRDDVTQNAQVRTGEPGGSPEIYEKLAANGRGAVVMFASAAGTYEYVTRQPVTARFVATDGLTVALDPSRRACLRATFSGAGARFVFFGAE